MKKIATMTDSKIIHSDLSIDEVKNFKSILLVWDTEDQKNINGVIFTKNNLRKVIASYYISKLKNPTVPFAKSIIAKSKTVYATYYDYQGDKLYRKGEYKWQLWYSNTWTNIINDYPNGDLISINNLINAVQVFEEI